MGFHLDEKIVRKSAENLASAELKATYLGNIDTGRKHSVRILYAFGCGGWFTNKCCLLKESSQNFIDGNEVVAPKKERTECYIAKDVSDQECAAYQPGFCGVHIRQYQKNQGPGFTPANYRFDIILKDNSKMIVGERYLLNIPSGTMVEFESNLPHKFGVKAPELDDDAVYMLYNSENWGSNDQEHFCNFGAYDSGHRDGDCGFRCD
jgi:hypothetical protein